MDTTRKQVNSRAQYRLANPHTTHSYGLNSYAVIPGRGSRPEESARCARTVVSPSSPALWHWRKFALFPRLYTGSRYKVQLCCLKKSNVPIVGTQQAKPYEFSRETYALVASINQVSHSKSHIMPLFELTDDLQPANPAKYNLVTGTPPSCIGNQKICTIDAADDGSGKPDLDTAILSEMVTALQTNSNQPHVNLKA